MDFIYTYRNSSDMASTSVECRRLLYELINNRCQGNNDDTRGGEASSSGGNSFQVDPTTHNCNCYRLKRLKIDMHGAIISILV